MLLEMETMFMALADRTRLRLLNLMAGEEVCVNFFTEVLGESQPKVSRHLAYLRNSDLVETRRNGKWIYYSIKWPESSGLAVVLNSTLEVLADDPELKEDKVRLAAMNSNPVQPSTVPVLPGASQNAPIYDAPTPARPVHNELDEFLL